MSPSTSPRKRQRETVETYDRKWVADRWGARRAVGEHRHDPYFSEATWCRRAVAPTLRSRRMRTRVGAESVRNPHLCRDGGQLS